MKLYLVCYYDGYYPSGIHAVVDTLAEALEVAGQLEANKSHWADNIEVVVVEAGEAPRSVYP